MVGSITATIFLLCCLTIAFTLTYSKDVDKRESQLKVSLFDVINKEDDLQGVPKRMLLLSGFEFLTLGGVFLGVENNSKNFGNQKIKSCLAKF